MPNTVLVKVVGHLTGDEGKYGPGMALVYLNDEAICSLLVGEEIKITIKDPEIVTRLRQGS